MATWQPPIPYGALYSRPARDLGSAVALLAWCYDVVKRDGWCEIKLKEVSGVMDEPYHTVVKWWAKLQDGPFFAEVIDRGKSGFRVRFADDWLEWRILSTRGNSIPTPREMPDQVIEAQEEPAPMIVQRPVKNSSITGELPNQVIEAPAYKVLSISGDHGLPVSSDDEPSPTIAEPKAEPKTSPNRNPKRKAAAPAEPPTPIEIRQALADVCAIDLKHAHKTRILQVNDEAKAIWAMQQERGKSVVQTVKAIGMVAEYCRRSVYPYKDGQPITPSAIHNAWDSARQSLERTNGLNGHHHVAEPESEGQYISREELLATRGGGGK